MTIFSPPDKLLDTATYSYLGADDRPYSRKLRLLAEARLSAPEVS
jgi:hypothetical protein